MHKATYIIKTEDDIAPCVALLKERLKVEPLEVVISTLTRQRSAQQHRLYWLWCTQIGNHMGLRKDEIHEILKRTFAVPIFTRDDKGYAELIVAVMAVRDENKMLRYEAMAKQIVRMTSTTDFTVPQMTEYLTDIEHYAAELGANLTFPDDIIGYK